MFQIVCHSQIQNGSLPSIPLLRDPQVFSLLVSRLILSEIQSRISNQRFYVPEISDILDLCQYSDCQIITH